MKYSYSATTGFQTAPSAQTQYTQRPVPPPPPPRPANHYTQSPPQSPPASGSHYPSFAGSQPQSPYSPHTPPSYGQPQSPPGYGQPQSPPPPPPRQAHSRAPSMSSTGYTPVNYDTPHSSGYTPEQFYGSLIDMNNRPTEVFSRLADACFFWVDQNCEIPGLRGTGVIEPAKYAWMSGKMGADANACQTVQEYLPSFYEMASIPHRYVQSQHGQVAIVDRRGWLHMSVFEARATPEESHQHWNKALAIFNLLDPLTNTPFPTPLPRSALPTYADTNLSSIYMGWRTQAIIGASRARTNEMMQNILGNRPSYNPYAFAAGASAGGLGAGAYSNAFGGGGSNPLAGMTGSSGGGGGGGGDGSHATMMDTVNTLGTLANTILGGFGAGGTGFNFGN